MAPEVAATAAESAGAASAVETPSSVTPSSGGDGGASVDSGAVLTDEQILGIRGFAVVHDSNP